MSIPTSDSIAEKRPISKGKSSKSSVKRKKRATKRKRDTSYEYSSDKESCGVCFKAEKDGEDWICCDLCLVWFHRECVALQDDEEWILYSTDGAVFACPLCI